MSVTSPIKNPSSPIKKCEFSNKKSGKKNGVRHKRKVEGYYAELIKMVIFRNGISKILVFLPQKAGGALRIRNGNFILTRIRISSLNPSINCAEPWWCSAFLRTFYALPIQEKVRRKYRFFNARPARRNFNAFHCSLVFGQSG